MKILCNFKSATLIFVAVLSFLCINSSYAVDKIWIGGNGNWNVVTNWSPNGLPGSADRVVFQNGTFLINVDYNNSAIQGFYINNANVTLSATAARNIYCSDVINVYSGNFTISTYIKVNLTSTSISYVSSGTTLTIANSGCLAIDNGSLRVLGTLSTNSVTNLSCSNGNTVIYMSSSADQVIATGQYYNLTFNNYRKDLRNRTINISNTLTKGSNSEHQLDNSTIEFNGGVNQTIPIVNSTTGYNNLTINNSLTVTPSGMVRVGTSGVLTFTKGIVLNDASNMIYVDNTSYNAVVITPANIYGENASYVKGPFKRAIPNITNNNDYFFPVGDGNNNCRPFVLSGFTCSSAGYITAECNVGPTGGTAGAGMGSLSKTRYWYVTLTTCTLTACKVKIYELNLNSSSRIGQSSTLTGSYAALTNSATPTTFIESTSVNDLTLKYFVLNGLPGIWLGTTSTNWNTASNWDNGSVPTASCNGAINVYISNLATNMPAINSGNSGYCNDLTLNPATSITVNGTLNVCGNLTCKQSYLGTGALTQSDNATVNITGNATIERFSRTNWWCYLSSPFSNSAINHFTNWIPSLPGSSAGSYYNPDSPPNSTNFPNVWKITEPHSHDVNQDMNAWQAPASTSEAMTVMRGYIIQTGANSTSISYKIQRPGSYLNTGDKSYSLIRTQTSTDTGHNNCYLDVYGKTDPSGTLVGLGPGNGFNLLGNPYPSPVDWDAVYLDSYPANLFATITYYQATSQYYGVFGTYNYYAGGTGAMYQAPSQYIPPMYAFYVRSNSPDFSNINLTFKNSHRSVASAAISSGEDNTPYYKKDKKSKYPLLRLIAFKNANSNKMKDEAIITLIGDDTINTKTRFYGHKFFNSDPEVPNIYTFAGTDKLSINALTEIKDKHVVPVGFSANTDGEYTIQYPELNKKSITHKVYLIDALKKGKQDLTVNNSYTFDFTKGTANNRFYLVFSSATAGIDDLYSEIVDIYSYDKELNIIYNHPTDKKAVLSVYNLNGQEIMPDKNISNGTYNYKLNVSPGFYIVRLLTADKIYTQKIYIK